MAIRGSVADEMLVPSVHERSIMPVTKKEEIEDLFKVPDDCAFVFGGTATVEVLDLNRHIWR